MQARVVHFEVPYEDKDRATKFYEEIFEWNLMSMPELDYTGVSTGPAGEDGMPKEPGYIGGGMFQRAEGLDTPVIVMAVDDIDATMKTIEDAGGSSYRPKEAVGDMGWAAYFKDPEGNILGLWQTA